MSWLNKMKETGKAHAGGHPNAQVAYAPAPAAAPAPTPRPREGNGSLDLPKFTLALQADRAPGEPLVEAPVRALLDKDLKRVALRFPEDVERYLYAHTRGAVGSVVVALVIHSLRQLQANGQKLVLKEIDGEQVVTVEPEAAPQPPTSEET